MCWVVWESTCNLLRNHQALFPSGCTTHFPTSSARGSHFSATSSTLVNVRLADYSSPRRGEVLICISLMAEAMGHLFMCLLSIWVSLEKDSRFYPWFHPLAAAGHWAAPATPLACFAHLCNGENQPPVVILETE